MKNNWSKFLILRFLLKKEFNFWIFMLYYSDMYVSMLKFFYDVVYESDLWKL